ncbi:ABC transporter ATPase [Pedobacter chitinilyticus]|uniref:ABC transporter ATPase n=1 Tax=Pedobacter chitinilyticus TaxID=2233776 RepID=A0A443YKJ9_9SPHI|nr:ABC transporter ATPase [Pedobacter chitinilyticus]RWU04276.1 ABC transporter ATPase [Pedobacter chitinilyticus]
MIFSPQSKVWIYQSNRRFTDQETAEIQNILNDFVEQWTAHGHQLKARAEVFHHYFIVLTVDQEVANATGCSIDSSVRVIKEIESKFGLDLFDRFNMAYKIGDDVHVATKEDFETLISIKKIGLETIVFNNLVQTLEDFEQKWEVPLQDSWHKNIFAEQLNG